MLCRSHIGTRGQVIRDLDFQIVRPTLELVRQHIPAGLNLTPIDPDDELRPVEVWS